MLLEEFLKPLALTQTELAESPNEDLERRARPRRRATRTRVVDASAFVVGAISSPIRHGDVIGALGRTQRCVSPDQVTDNRYENAKWKNICHYQRVAAGTQRAALGTQRNDETGQRSVEGPE